MIGLRSRNSAPEPRSEVEPPVVRFEVEDLATWIEAKFMDHTNWGDLRSFLADPFQLQEPIRALWLRRVVTFHGEKAKRYVADHHRAGGLSADVFGAHGRVFPQDILEAREVHGDLRQRGGLKLLDALARGPSLDWKAPILNSFLLGKKSVEALGPAEEWAYSDWDQVPDKDSGWRLTDNLRHLDFSNYSAMEGLPGWERQSHLTGEGYPALWDQFTATGEGMPRLQSVVLSQDWHGLCHQVLEVDRGFAPLMNAPRIQKFRFRSGRLTRSDEWNAVSRWCWAQRVPPWEGFLKESRLDPLPRSAEWGGPTLTVYGLRGLLPGGTTGLVMYIDEGPPPASPEEVKPPTCCTVNLKFGDV
jgi:hypothetical protein